ncbi:hypothetical protein [Nostoc sp. NMS4]|nr:hypothetical protein [Nostoc sp. NMS4]
MGGRGQGDEGDEGDKGDKGDEEINKIPNSALSTPNAQSKI